MAIALVQGGASDTAQTFFIEPTETPRPGTTPTPDARPRTRTAVDVHLGPGEAFGIVGTLARGEAVEIVGRDADSTWVAIRFPPGSAARGWLPVSEVEGVGSLDRLAVALATPLPRTVVIPAGPSGSGTGGGRPLIEGPPPTQGPNVGPTDVTVTSATLLSDGRVRVVIVNHGPGDVLQRTVDVLVRDLQTRSELVIGLRTNLAVGESQTFTTQYFLVTSPTEIQAVVDPYGNLSDPNTTNNVLSVTLAPVLPPTPTPTPGRIERDPEP